MYHSTLLSSSTRVIYISLKVIETHVSSIESSYLDKGTYNETMLRMTMMSLY